jgi:cytosine permease
MEAADIRPVPPDARRQSAFDLFLIFAGANIVATTFQVGASLAPRFHLRTVCFLIVAGSTAGAAIVAALAPVGSRLGVPSVIAARAALGRHGAALVALLLFSGNFAWIAINNVIAASACARLFGGAFAPRTWAVALGILATAVVAGGPRMVGITDRIAVPLLSVIGVSLTIACARAVWSIETAPSLDMSLMRGLDIVIGYQVSWLLMFADYSRYTASPAKSGVAVFLGLALTSIWLMPLGAIAARVASSFDPAAMLQAVGLGAAGAILLALATLTTNFVNIYLSSLAWRSLVPSSRDLTTVWVVGLVGAALSLLDQAWLTRYGDFMLVLGGVLVPAGGVFFARFFLDRAPVNVPALYETSSGTLAALSMAGVVAWIAGCVVYYLASGIGATLPALLTSIAVYLVMRRLSI